MKTLTIIFLISLIRLTAFSQLKTSRYIELRASVDNSGNIYVSSVISRSKEFKNADSAYLAEIKKINNAIATFKYPSLIFTELATFNWELVSTASVTKAEQGGPNTPFLLYYIRKNE